MHVLNPGARLSKCESDCPRPGSIPESKDSECVVKHGVESGEITQS